MPYFRFVLKRSLIIFTMFSSFYFTASHLHAQTLDETDTRALMEANFLFQFANHNQWPSEMKKGRFTIYVVSNQNVFELFQNKYGTQTIGLQPIDVQLIQDINQISGIPHLIFIDKSKKNECSMAQKKFKNKSTLIVTNFDGALKSGAHINFKNINGSIRYEVNELAMNDEKIQAGVKILQWKIND